MVGDALTRGEIVREGVGKSRIARYKWKLAKVEDYRHDTTRKNNPPA